MPAFNNGFPATYPQMYPQFNPFMPQQQMQQQMQQPQQAMTPPTIHAEIVQVDDEQAAANYPVGAGASQMMIAKDDSAIYVKSAGQNGTTLDVFIKRPPAPPAPVFDPAAYIRRDEIADVVAAVLSAQKGGADE